MRTSNYSESLKDPRWQRRRLEIFQRDGFACVHCGSKTTTLHVHHLDYWPGVEPWEYPDLWLDTVCETCHEELTTYGREKRRSFGSLSQRVFVAFKKIGPNAGQGLLNAAVYAAERHGITPQEMAEAMVWISFQHGWMTEALAQHTEFLKAMGELPDDDADTGDR